MNPDLVPLLAAAEAAGPQERIEYRDPIAAHGAEAIAPLRSWVALPKLGAFAVRTLQRIGEDPENRGAVVEALAGIDQSALSPPVAADVTEALLALGACGAHRSGSRAAAGTAPEVWPGHRKVSALELRFHRDMLDIFRLAGEATRRQRPDGTFERGYWASYYLRGVRNHGGLEYARQLLRKAGTSAGFERLAQEDHLELSVEALVLNPAYESLFTEAERDLALERLGDAGFTLSH